MSKKYTLKEFAEKINIHPHTLQRWDREGVLPAHRTPTNRRYYTDNDYRKYIGEEPLIENEDRATVGYVRVNTSAQRGSIKTQTQFIQNYCEKNGIELEMIYADIGSGFDPNRNAFRKMMERCERDEINSIIITHKDKLFQYMADNIILLLHQKFDVEVVNLAIDEPNCFIDDLDDALGLLKRLSTDRRITDKPVKYLEKALEGYLVPYEIINKIEPENNVLFLDPNTIQLYWGRGKDKKARKKRKSKKRKEDDMEII